MKLSRTTWPGLVLVWIVAMLSWPGVAAGQGTLPGAEPPAQEPRWYQILPPSQPGFPVALSGSYALWAASPTLVDLDGNGTLEIVAGGRGRNNNQMTCGGMVYAYRPDGTLMWQTSVRAPVNSTPTAADLNGDGHPDIIVALGGIADGPCWDGGVVALNGLNGAELWLFNTQDWLNHRHDGMRDGVISTPAVDDVNGDGQPEIAFGAWDQCFYLLNKNGVPLWGNLPGILPEVYCGGHGYYNEDTYWSSPALADLTGDGLPEIVTGADVYTGNVWGDPTGGYVYVFDANGNALAREWQDQDVYSSPAIADLDNDGALEVVVGTGMFVAGKGYYVSAFDYDPNGGSPTNRLVLRWRTPTVGRVFASPAIGDLDADGVPDVAIVSPKGDNGADGSYAYGLRGSDGAVLWQRRACDMWGNSFNTLSSAVIADIDGDNRPEVLYSHSWEVLILNHDGTYYTDYSNPLGGAPRHSGCARTHQPTTELSYWAEYTLMATPSVGDLDGDGDMEVVVLGQNPDNTVQGMLFAWTGHPAEEAPIWPTFHQNERHTGLYLFDVTPPTNPTSLTSPSHTPGQWSTNNVVQAAWSGAGDQGSGVAGYSIVWNTSAGTLPDAVLDVPAETTTASSAPLADGDSYYFHLRTADKAGNWAPGAVHLGPFWIDAHAPNSTAGSPELATGPFVVSWGGQDGGSGVMDYTIQARQDQGAWTIWLEHVTNMSATYQPVTAGHTYRFRSIARDHVGNVETAYTDQGDTATVVARRLVSGSVYDLRGRPVPGATMTSQPPALNLPLSDAAGGYTLGVPDDGAYGILADAPGYGALPARYVQVSANVTGIDLYLPPEQNVVQHGDFEQSGGWALAGPVPPSRVEGAGFTGDYGLKLGELPRAPDAGGTWSAAQEVSVPGQGGSVLAWNWRVEGNSGSGDVWTVTVDGPSSDVTRELSLDVNTWRHGFINLRQFAGQQVEIRFVLDRQSTSAPLTVWLDDVSLGRVPYRAYLPLLERR